MPKKTICEVEFEKYWEEYHGGTHQFSTYQVSKMGFQRLWNRSWKTCADKIMESIKKK